MAATQVTEVRNSEPMKLFPAIALVLSLLVAAPLIAATSDDLLDPTHLAGLSKEDLSELEALRILIKQEPRNAELQELLGNLLLRAEVEVSEETAKEAEYHLRRAVELDYTRYGAWYDLAILHMDTDEGNRYLQNAIAANPMFPEPYYWLAYTYARNRRDTEAIPIFKQYLEVAQGNPNEDSRMRTAGKLLTELEGGSEGEELGKVRRPTEEKNL